MRRILRWTGGLLIAAALGAAAVVGAWFVDERVMHDDAVPRNVVLAGHQIGGFSEAELDSLLDVISADVASTPLAIDVAPRRFVTTYATAGVALDHNTVTNRALTLGRDGDLADQFETWWESLRSQRSIDLAYTYDPEMTEAWLESHPARVLSHPEEPSFTGLNGKLEVSEGDPGEQLDPSAIAGSVAAAVDSQAPPFDATSSWVPLLPQVSPETLQAAIDEADALASTPLTVRVGNQTVRLGRETVRRWIESERSGGDIGPTLATDRIEATMERVLAGIQTEATPPEFTIVDGQVETTLGVPSEKCCGDGVGELVAAALLDPEDQVVEMPLVPVETPEAQAARYGIRELVAEFTTNHACCQSRVNNIQRMADIVRGAIVMPGETFSLNGHVGERTRDNGFVPAGTILSGRIVDTVGGGVSQFATTTFNAAFFAGFDFVEYQSHSIYISRYPYGREATINWPDVDLEIENTTPYAAMLWTEYTGTSITVQLWSTPYFEVEQTGQVTGSWGRACRRVTTFRSRTAPDGRTLEDSVFAIYRPAEGLDCNGNPTPDPNV